MAFPAGLKVSTALGNPLLLTLTGANYNQTGLTEWENCNTNHFNPEHLHILWRELVGWFRDLNLSIYSRFDLFAILGLIVKEENSSPQNELCFRKLGRAPWWFLYTVPRGTENLQHWRVSWSGNMKTEEGRAPLVIRSYPLLHPDIGRSKENPEPTP